jgi:dTDP-4-dehydrorhamnose 3,5-epimerase
MAIIRRESHTDPSTKPTPLVSYAGAMNPVLVEPKVFADDRGFFLEAFNQGEFDRLIGEHVSFVQDNHSRSIQGVLRGLHYQLPPHAQGKLVRVTRGAAFDVVVDIRRSSPEFGSWMGYEMSEDNFRQLWIPPGFAHGFLALSDVVDVLYKTTAYYTLHLDRSLRWDDPAIRIDWPLDGLAPIVSPKDQAAPSLADAELFE